MNRKKFLGALALLTLTYFGGDAEMGKRVDEEKQDEQPKGGRVEEEQPTPRPRDGGQAEPTQPPPTNPGDLEGGRKPRP